MICQRLVPSWADDKLGTRQVGRKEEMPLAREGTCHRPQDSLSVLRDEGARQLVSYYDCPAGILAKTSTTLYSKSEKQPTRFLSFICSSWWARLRPQRDGQATNNNKAGSRAPPSGLRQPAPCRGSCFFCIRSMVWRRLWKGLPQTVFLQSTSKLSENGLQTSLQTKKVGRKGKPCTCTHCAFAYRKL